MWNLTAPPGFRALIEDRPLNVYLRHLPHWRQDGATYFVTFRLADSLPQSKLHELAELQRDWHRRNPPPQEAAALDQLSRLVTERTERWLDQGLGSCVLKHTATNRFVSETMHHFNGQRYELGAYVIMPNHVHTIVRPTICHEYPLEKLLKTWKQFSATNINLKTGRTGSLWQDESSDRIIRDAEHLDRCLQYIGRNPRMAGLSKNQCPLWVHPDWVACGWTFRDN